MLLSTAASTRALCLIVCLSQLQYLHLQIADTCRTKILSFGYHVDLPTCCAQALSYAGYPTVEALHTAPSPDEALVQGNRSIAVRGAADGLMFGPTPDAVAQTVFDTAFYRPVNTTFTGDGCYRPTHASSRAARQARMQCHAHL